MKLICSKANLLKGVNIVSKAVPTRTTMAILECILIDASTNEIKLMANDMELGIETKVEGDIAERGVIALDAKIFSEIVRKLPDSEVTISTDPSFKTVITCEKAKFNIVGKSGDDFSYIPNVEKKDSIIMSQFTLKEIVRQTIFSIADNDNNKIMTGEYFEITENQLKVVSLDGQINPMFGLFFSIVILHALLNSHANRASIPPFFIPTSNPIAPEKKLNATIGGTLSSILSWSSGSITTSYFSIYCCKSSSDVSH